MISELCVIGHPSWCGGADTELFHQIKCWHKMGIKTKILHTGPISNYYKKMEMEQYGCEYLAKPRQWQLARGLHVISFCNSEFLSNLHYIHRYAKSTTFVNCMTYNFKKEMECQDKGLIDFHLYQSDHGMQNISKNMSHMKDYRPMRFTPYFDSDQFEYIDKRPNDHFRFGRISRCDSTKFHSRQFQIYDAIKSPVEKSGVVLGWGPVVNAKMKIPKKDLNKRGTDTFYKNYIQIIDEGKISQEDFYKFSDVLIMATETFENLPRVGFEAMASGTILMVDRRGGWKVEVEDEKTGFLCNTPRDFVEKATYLASNPDHKEEIRGLARQKLETEWGFENASKSWEKVFAEWEKLR